MMDISMGGGGAKKKKGGEQLKVISRPGNCP